MTVQDYIKLITSENADKPDFVAVIGFSVSPAVRIQELMASMIPIFDLDTPPVGNQLDIIGQWVGISREINVPISGTDVYFTWDGTNPFVGWDSGSWQPTDVPVDITTLPDGAYLNLIRGKIAANQWDGTTNGAYKIWNALFTNFTILIQDYQNMSYAVGIVGGLPDALTLALITGGYIPLRPEGVLITEYFVAIDTGPLFGWDVESTLISGWDVGSWAMEIPAT